MTSPSDKYATHFDEALDRQLKSRGMTRAKLAAKAGVKPDYLSHVTAGRRPARPDLINTFAGAMGSSHAERVELHRAAAADLGYTLDLSTPQPEKR